MTQQSPERNDDQNILAITVLFGIVIVLMFLVFLNQPVQEAPPEVVAAQTEAAVIIEPTVVAVVPTATAVAAEPTAIAGELHAAYTTEQVAAGQRVFGGICFACHGQGGVGVAGLGKPLVNSEFVDGMTDEEMVAFLIAGRQPSDPLNTTGQLMPARGGNPMLSDQDLYNVVAYIRSLSGAPVGDGAASSGGQTAAPDAAPTEYRLPTAAEDWVAPPINALDRSVVAPAIVNTGTLNESATTDGVELYTWYCAACHGPAGEGVNGEAALAGMDVDYDLFVQMITMAAPPDSPEQTGFLHPYRGGAPGMNDAQIAALIEFLQGLGG